MIPRVLSSNRSLAPLDLIRKEFFYTPVFLFTLVLTLKYYGMQMLVFGNANPFQCLAVAVPSLLVLLIPIELLFKRKKTQAFLALNTLISAGILAIVVYFRQFGIVVTYRAFFQAHQVLEVGDSILDLLQPLNVLFFADIILWFLFRLFKAAPKLSDMRFRRSGLLAVLSLSLGVIIFYSIIYKDILNELKKAERMGLVGYEVHALITGVQEETTTASAHPVTPEMVRSVKNLPEPSTLQYFGAAKGRNVIVIQLESFQNFLIGKEVDGKPLTPTLNTLLTDSFYFPNVFQQISQGNTSDAEFITNTSFYPPANGAASQEYGKKMLPSLPRMLNSLGYKTVTLHTNEVTFWNRNELYSALGFQRYYDKEYFGEEDKIAFSASDEVLYRKTANLFEQFSTEGKPFYAHVISMSSHHPFIPPEDKEMLSLPEEWNGTDIGNYLIMTNYADRALGMFIDRLKEDGLWENSMLVIYGDHFGVSPHNLKPEEKEMLEGLLGNEYDMRTVHNIPFIITVPGVTDGGIQLNQIGGQVDFMPTIANLLGVPLTNHVYFGQDLLNYPDNILGSRYYLPTGSFINDEIMYMSGETYGDGTVIPVHADDPQVDVDPMHYKDDFVQIIKLLQLNDSYLHSLPEQPESK
jgi:lipoteichoic acid synthase